MVIIRPLRCWNIRCMKFITKVDRNRVTGWKTCSTSSRSLACHFCPLLLCLTLNFRISAYLRAQIITVGWESMATTNCHVTRLMAALQDKTLPNDSPSLSFQKKQKNKKTKKQKNKTLHLALLWLKDYHKRQRSQLVRFSDLQKLMQKIWTLSTSGNGRCLFVFQTKLH